MTMSWLVGIGYWTPVLQSCLYSNHWDISPGPWMHLFPLIIVPTVGESKEMLGFQRWPSTVHSTNICKATALVFLSWMSRMRPGAMPLLRINLQRGPHQSSQRCRCTPSGALDRVGCETLVTSMDLWELVLLDMHPRWTPMPSGWRICHANLHYVCLIGGNDKFIEAL